MRNAPAFAWAVLIILAAVPCRAEELPLSDLFAVGGSLASRASLISGNIPGEEFLEPGLKEIAGDATAYDYRVNWNDLHPYYLKELRVLTDWPAQLSPGIPPRESAPLSAEERARPRDYKFQIKGQWRYANTKPGPPPDVSQCWKKQGETWTALRWQEKTGLWDAYTAEERLAILGKVVEQKGFISAGEEAQVAAQWKQDLDSYMAGSSNQMKKQLFKSKFLAGFRVFDNAGKQIADIKGDWKGWNFKILTTDGKEMGVITKKWAGLGKELFTSADNYMVEIREGFGGQDAVTLLLGAALAIDVLYKEKG